MNLRDRPAAWVDTRNNSGVDAKALLQGLMTNDVSLLDEDKKRLPCISTAFLSPKVRLTVFLRQAAQNLPNNFVVVVVLSLSLSLSLYLTYRRRC